MYVTQLTGAQRKWRDVQQEYHAAGERSVSSTAHRVGISTHRVGISVSCTAHRIGVRSSCTAQLVSGLLVNPNWTYLHHQGNKPKLKKLQSRKTAGH